MRKGDIEISVIVPVYNIEKYLPRLIDSVLKQSFEDFEIILVNDGSIDKSGKICDEYALKDDRVKVIHQKNQGAHMARNNAMNEARGKYICFFDGDDYVDKDMLKDTYNMAESYDLDLVVTGFYIETYYADDKFFTLDYIPKDNIFYDKESFRKNSIQYFDINMFYPPWNKLYKKSYLDRYNIKFPVTYRDDFPFVMEVIRDIERIGFNSKQYYHFYRQRSESETQKYVKNLYEKREEEQVLMINMISYWKMIDDVDARDMLARRYIDRLVECFVNLYNKNSDLSDENRKKEIKRYVNNQYLDICLEDAKPKKLYLKIMYDVIKTKNVNLIINMTKFITSVKTKNVKAFNLLKKNR